MISILTNVRPSRQFNMRDTRNPPCRRRRWKPALLQLSREPWNWHKRRLLPADYWPYPCGNMVWPYIKELSGTYLPSDTNGYLPTYQPTAPAELACQSSSTCPQQTTFQHDSSICTTNQMAPWPGTHPDCNCYMCLHCLLCYSPCVHNLAALLLLLLLLCLLAAANLYIVVSQDVVTVAVVYLKWPDACVVRDQHLCCLLPLRHQHICALIIIISLKTIPFV